MRDHPVDILEHDSTEFVTAAARRGVKRPEALRLYRTAYREATAAAPWITLNAAPIVNGQAEQHTEKFIQRLPDGLETESVVIPMRGRSGRETNTLCVSSQVGCAMGCTFCETAQMGLMRHLTTAEIIGQWFAARHVLKTSIKNIVFMGMGEPMDNLDSVIHAIRILVDHNGPSVPASNITVSTVGRPEGIRRLAALAAQPGFGRLNLAVSINAPDDAVRSTLMPINRRHPMSELFAAMQAWPLRPAGAILIEYVLIPGVNDHPHHADALATYLASLRCSVNVIPYNPRRDSPWPAPTEAMITEFMQRLVQRGLFVKRRQTKGRSVMAACGQLGNPHIRRRQFVQLATPDSPTARSSAAPSCREEPA